VLQLGPLLPLDQTPKIPESAHARWMSSNIGSVDGNRLPHELLTMCGRLLTSGFWPLRSVGASIHCDERSSVSSLGQQPLAAIQVTAGATPIWLPVPSSPTIVPIVWVPWPFASHGPSGQEPWASNQL
jgi:hypothetical protein